MLREALGLRLGGLPKEHPDTAETESVLGACLVAQGRFAEAEPLLVGSHRLMLAKRTDRSRETRDALDRIVQLYAKWGRPEEARRYASTQAGPAR